MTGIEWVLNPDGSRGITVNSKTGCLNHIDGLCKGGGFPCYAYKLAHGRLKQRYLAKHCLATAGIEPSQLQDFYNKQADPFYPRFWPERLDKIRAIKKPTGIFLDDMSDWMGDYWPEEWTRQELQVMRDCPQHRFYTLTKQAQRLPKFSPFPENVYIGVTATNAKMLREALTYLNDIEATVKFVSLEPLLSRIYDPVQFINALPDFLFVLDWLIIGACTGNLPDMTLLGEKYPDLWLAGHDNKITAQPRIEWVQEIVEAADKAGVRVFLKNNLNPLINQDKISGQYALDTGLLNWEGQLRQEMPKLDQGGVV